MKVQLSGTQLEVAHNLLLYHDDFSVGVRSLLGFSFTLCRFISSIYWIVGSGKRSLYSKSPRARKSWIESVCVCVCVCVCVYVRGFSHPSTPALRPTQNSLQCVPRISLDKPAGAWRWQPIPLSAKVKEILELQLYPPSVHFWVLPE